MTAQLEAALVKADAAGDVEGAKVLAGEIRRLRSAPKGDTLQLAPQPSGMDNFLGGLKKAGTDTVLGVKQLGAMAGLGDSEALAQEAAQNKIRDAELMNSTGGMIGNAVGNVGMALLPGGALKLASKAAPALSSVANALLAPKSLKGAAALGAGIGVVQPAVDNEERVTNAAISGLGGVGGNLAARGISRVLSPQTDKAVTALMNQGVTPTPGQILGGTAKRMEDSATSIPILGDAIRMRQRGVIEEFDRAALNRAVSPIYGKVTPLAPDAPVRPPVVNGPLIGVDGRKALPSGATSMAVEGQKIVPYIPGSSKGGATPKGPEAIDAISSQSQRINSVGREGIAEAEKKIGASYDSILPNISLKADSAFDGQIQSLRGLVRTLPKSEADQFEAILKTHLTDKFTSSGRMSGYTFKEAEAELGRLARGYSGDPAFDKRQLGGALREAQASLRNLMQQQNPLYAEPLKNANEAWANFVRVQDASGRIGAKEGVFTPAHLSAAVRGQDKTLRHGAFARGEALMQDLSDAGQKVLSSTVPDSGTAGRGAIMAIAGGGLGAVNPVALGGTLGASALYHPQAQKVIAALLTQRPDLARNLGHVFQQGSGMGAIPGAALANSQE